MSFCKEKTLRQQNGDAESFSKWFSGTSPHQHSAQRQGCSRENIARPESTKGRERKNSLLWRGQTPPQLSKVRQRGAATEQVTAGAEPHVGSVLLQRRLSLCMPAKRHYFRGFCAPVQSSVFADGSCLLPSRLLRLRQALFTAALSVPDPLVRLGGFYSLLLNQ